MMTELKKFKRWLRDTEKYLKLMDEALKLKELLPKAFSATQRER